MNCYEPDREKPIDRILCNRCKHLRKGITCDAFPKGIPMEILRSEAHLLPVPGAHGIVFDEKQRTLLEYEFEYKNAIAVSIKAVMAFFILCD